MSRISCTFMSAALRRPINLTVIVPTDKCCAYHLYIPEHKPMKTLYLLEGMLSNETGFASYTRIQPIAEDNNLYVVIIGGENMHYADSDVTLNYYDKMVSNDVLKYTRATFNLSDKREDTFIGGFSMGGFGCVNVGLRHPDIYSRIVAMSPGMVKPWMMELIGKPAGTLSAQGFTEENYKAMYGIPNVAAFVNSKDDSDYLAEKVKKETPELMPKIFVAASADEDLCEPCIKPWKNNMVDLGYDLTYYELKGLGHSWPVAEYSLIEAMKWLPIDTFQGNFLQYTDDANLGNDLLAHFAVYYNL